MRIAAYNVEWMDQLFDDRGRPLDDTGWSGRHDVKRAEQLHALGSVFRVVDADLWIVVEAPDASRRRDGARALRTFADWAGLRACETLIGFANDTQQEIAALWDPAALTVRHDPCGGGSGETPRFDESYRIDLDIDARPEKVVWSKPPLELAVETAAGRAFRVIGVHAKSKAPHGARDRENALRIGIANRRKQLAQCIWLRARVDERLAQGEDVVVAGDFNDGPGLDAYEKLFGRSGVEIVMGADGGGAEMFDPHAALAAERRIGAMPASARFWQADRNRWLSVLLDYVMVSPGLRDAARGWRIWHPFDDPDCYRDAVLREALLLASDHFPVSLDLAV